MLPDSSTIRSIFIDNQHDQGMLYVFKEDFPLSELLTRMRAYVANPGNPEAVRVSMLANYFSIQPVPEEWTEFTPYSDDLTPEPLIYSYFVANWRSRVSGTQAAESWRRYCPEFCLDPLCEDTRIEKR